MKNNEPISITVDGTDGSGKRTASLYLQALCEKLGKECEVISFPQHNADSGMLVDKFLYEGLRFQGDQYKQAIREGMLYAIDRMVTLTKVDENGKSKLDEYNEGKMLIFDRYTSSNFIHRSREFDEDALKEYIDIMNVIEYNVIGIPKPNITFVLKVDPEVSIENIEKRGREKDENETIENLTIAHSKLESLCKMEGYVMIDCCKTDDSGKRVMKTTEEIVDVMIKKIIEIMK